MNQHLHPQALHAMNQAAGLLAAMLVTKNLHNFTDGQAEVAAQVLDDLREAIKLEPCTTPWPWMQMHHPALAEAKQAKRQIMIFVPSVLESINNGHRIRKPSKLLLVHWVDKLPPENKHKVLGRVAKNHMKKYGGYWATDNAGYRAVQHMPELWCALPVVVGQEWGR